MNIPFLHHVTVRDRAFLSRQLATMLSSGIPLAESVKVLTLETKNPLIKDSLNAIIHDLESGLSFSASIERQPHLFSKVYVAVTRSGEAAGKLEDVLLQLADNIEKENSLIGKVKSAMVYPVFILLAMVGVAILMMVRVLPQLKSVFTESGAQLPLATRFLIKTSDIMIQYWYLLVMGFVAAVIGLRLYLKTPSGILLLNQIQVRLPGGLSEGLYMARFTRTMSMLIKAGIPIIEALDISSEVMNNIIYLESLQQAEAQVERGIPLSTPLNQNPFFPKIVAQMVLVGEQTGRLDAILEKLALYYEEDVDTKIRGLSSLIEPVIIVILGIGVAFLVMAILMPIYNITNIQ